MSTYNEIDITCEKCGDDYRGTVWTAVNAKQDPELKDILLGGELNMVMCPHCSHVAYQDQFILYQDPEAQLLAYVYPPTQQANEAELRQIMLRGFRDAQEVYEPKERLSYGPTLMFGLETLVEMLHSEEEIIEQSDVAEAVTREKRIPRLVLEPAVARSKGLPRVLPLSQESKSPTRAEVLEGIQRLLGENPALTVYEGLRKKIAADPAWLL